MDTLESIEPSPTTFPSSQPAESVQLSPSPFAIELSPSPFISANENTNSTSTNESDFKIALFYVIGLLCLSVLVILVKCIRECYYNITGKPRPQRESTRVGGDRTAAKWGRYGGGGCGAGGGGGGGCGGGGCGGGGCG